MRTAALVAGLSALIAVEAMAGPAVTQASKKAATISMSSDQRAVLNVLGPPTWVAVPLDDGAFRLTNDAVSFVLYWRNTPCSPVAVSFDSSGRAVGVDEGRGVCGPNVQLFELEPSVDYACSLEDRAELCR